LQYNNNSVISLSYFFWRNGAAVDLSTLVPGLVSAIDLNDSSLILGTRDAEKPFLYDMGANTVVALPDLVVADAVENPTMIGVDDAGRVVASVLTNKPTDTPRDVYWLPAGGTSWIYTGMSQTKAHPVILSKRGLVLASCLDSHKGFSGC
jgi:hypothetical protein